MHGNMSMNLNHVMCPIEIGGKKGTKILNTIEFRISNGSLDSEVIMQNAKLYGKIIEFSKKNAENYEYKSESLWNFYNVKTEKEKIKFLLDMLFDSDKDKEIYYRRWKMHPVDEVYNRLMMKEQKDSILTNSL